MRDHNFYNAGTQNFWAKLARGLAAGPIQVTDFLEQLEAATSRQRKLIWLRDRGWCREGRVKMKKPRTGGRGLLGSSCGTGDEREPITVASIWVFEAPRTTLARITIWPQPFAHNF
jgi:hypothetical protein